MSLHDSAKLRAAKEASLLVESKMVVGLGSGTTATEMIRQLGERIESEGLNFVGVPTSEASAELARSVGISIRQLDEVEFLDLCLDGADQINSRYQMIKGRGGALLREKLVASVAERRVTMITPEKHVELLGNIPIAVEVARFGLQHTERRLRAVGAETSIRTNPDGTPYLTDGGNAIVDCLFESIGDPAAMNSRLKALPGVFETGLFIDMCDLLIVGHEDRVVTIESLIRF